MLVRHLSLWLLLDESAGECQALRSHRGADLLCRVRGIYRAAALLSQTFADRRLRLPPDGQRADAADFRGPPRPLLHRHGAMSRLIYYTYFKAAAFDLTEVPGAARQDDCRLR